MDFLDTSFGRRPPDNDSDDDWLCEACGEPVELEPGTRRTARCPVCDACPYCGCSDVDRFGHYPYCLRPPDNRCASSETPIGDRDGLCEACDEVPCCDCGIPVEGGEGICNECYARRYRFVGPTPLVTDPTRVIPWRYRCPRLFSAVDATVDALVYGACAIGYGVYLLGLAIVVCVSAVWAAELVAASIVGVIFLLPVFALAVAVYAVAKMARFFVKAR